MKRADIKDGQAYWVDRYRSDNKAVAVRPDMVWCLPDRPGAETFTVPDPWEKGKTVEITARPLGENDIRTHVMVLIRTEEWTSEGVQPLTDVCSITVNQLRGNYDVVKDQREAATRREHKERSEKEAARKAARKTLDKQMKRLSSELGVQVTGYVSGARGDLYFPLDAIERLTGRKEG